MPEDNPLFVALIFIFSAVLMGLLILLFLGVRWLHQRYTTRFLNWSTVAVKQHKRILFVWVVCSLTLGVALRYAQILALKKQLEEQRTAAMESQKAGQETQRKYAEFMNAHPNSKETIYDFVAEHPSPDTQTKAVQLDMSKATPIQ